MNRFRSAIAAAAVLSCIVAATAGWTGTASARPAGAVSGYDRQAHAAGLTAAQASRLRRTIQKYVSTTGGRQVAYNRIDLGGAGMLVLALPGEKYARDPAKPLSDQAPQAAPPCYGGDLCLYQNTYYRGSYKYYYACRPVPRPWNTAGSFRDNQSTGTVTKLWYSTTRYDRAIAKVNVPEIGWTNYLKITVC